jgi:hypothetical protein
MPIRTDDLLAVFEFGNKYGRLNGSVYPNLGPFCNSGGPMNQDGAYVFQSPSISAPTIGSNSAGDWITCNDGLQFLQTDIGDPGNVAICAMAANNEPSTANAGSIAATSYTTAPSGEFGFNLFFSSNGLGIQYNRMTWNGSSLFTASSGIINDGFDTTKWAVYWAGSDYYQASPLAGFNYLERHTPSYVKAVRNTLGNAGYDLGVRNIRLGGDYAGGTQGGAKLKYIAIFKKWPNVTERLYLSNALFNQFNLFSWGT